MSASTGFDEVTAGCGMAAKLASSILHSRKILRSNNLVGDGLSYFTHQHSLRIFAQENPAEQSYEVDCARHIDQFRVVK